jgi:Zn-dependent peptidase ImmA (M78 family)
LTTSWNGFGEHRGTRAPADSDILLRGPAKKKVISDADREWLEWQAYSFAGLILVPGEPLKERLGKAVRFATQQGFSIEKAPDPAKDYLCTWLGRQFAVSSQVIEKRLDKDRLWPPAKV